MAMMLVRIGSCCDDLSKTGRRNADGVDQPRRNGDEGDAKVELMLVRPREKDGDVGRQW